MAMKPTGVEFLLPWRGRTPGDSDTGLDYGVSQLLVQRGIAKWKETNEPRSKRRERSKPLESVGD